MRTKVQTTIRRFQELLQGEGGIAQSLQELETEGGIRAAELSPIEVAALHIQAELSERAMSVRRPIFHIYCDRIENSGFERFRRFAGLLRIVTEIRLTQDRIHGLTELLHRYVDAVCDVVERTSGCAPEGLVLDGKYEVVLDPIKKGGLAYSQTAKVICPVLVTR